MTLYTLAGKVVLGTPIRGVCIDAMQVKPRPPPRTSSAASPTAPPDQLDEWLNDLSIVLAPERNLRRADYWPMNDTACDKFGGCKFRSICSKSPSVRDRFSSC